MVFSFRLQHSVIALNSHSLSLQLPLKEILVLASEVSQNKKSSHGGDSRPFIFYPHSYSSKPTKEKNLCLQRPILPSRPTTKMMDA